jgi:hypothetical protein
MAGLDPDAAMRIGLRRQLEGLASERERVVAHLAYLDRTVAETAERLRQVEATR